MEDKRKNNGGHSTAGKAGRPSQRDELKAIDLASPHVESAFRVIAEITVNPDENSRDRIAAAKILIEYGCGKPEQNVNTNLTVNDFDIKDVLKFKE
ncbi:hypothetical protein UFOVP388_30 [uncultured Caudovirales phage]|uniref:Uncharacterized protein n=1 Tax=uncultured Caudovirales phage TaxID=2100421 RepID=A0A6J7X0X1_9CAUD|nr:hypothetical protein UFOVP388_30 [uncultured Caudovirales phage]